jgi:hypothetical protein
MALSRDKYVNNTEENRNKLIDKILCDAKLDKVLNIAYQGLIERYIDNDQAFIEDYYEIFPDEDPELNGVQEEEKNKIIYYHGHHSNPCVVGEIHIPTLIKMTDGSHHTDIEVIMITHDIICEDYNDNLSDITKVWDSQTQSEVYNSRYDTDPDTCIHIPLNIGEHTSLSSQVLKQILLKKNVELVKIQYDVNGHYTLDEFLTECLGV